MDFVGFFAHCIQTWSQPLLLIVACAFVFLNEMTSLQCYFVTATFRCILNFEYFSLFQLHSSLKPVFLNGDVKCLLEKAKIWKLDQSTKNYHKILAHLCPSAKFCEDYCSGANMWNIQLLHDDAKSKLPCLSGCINLTTSESICIYEVHHLLQPTEFARTSGWNSI